MLSLLVVVASLAWPTLVGAFSGQRLRTAADQVRAEWTRLRVEAMTSGTTQMFRFVPETGVYVAEPYIDLETGIEAASTDAGAQLALQEAAQWSLGVSSPEAVRLPGQRGLPEGVTFVAGSTEVAARASLAPAEATTSAGSPLPADPLLFYADGTCSSATVLLRSDDELYVKIELRGLTGVTTISDILRPEELMP